VKSCGLAGTSTSAPQCVQGLYKANLCDNLVQKMEATGYSLDCYRPGIDKYCRGVYFSIGGGPVGDGTYELDLLFASFSSDFYDHGTTCVTDARCWIGDFECGFRGLVTVNVSGTWFLDICQATLTNNFAFATGIIGSFCTFFTI